MDLAEEDVKVERVIVQRQPDREDARDSKVSARVEHKVFAIQMTLRMQININYSLNQLRPKFPCTELTFNLVRFDLIRKKIPKCMLF